MYVQQSGLREVVASSFYMEEFWNKMDISDIGLWRLVGTKEGFIRLLPGARLAIKYDGTKRSWSVLKNIVGEPVTR